MKKQRWDHSDNSNDSGDSDRNSSEKIDLSLIPFTKSEPSHMDKVWKLTAKLHENYVWDPRLVKHKILTSQQCPVFPMSLWGDIISNSFIDLNRVFNIHFTSDGPSKWSIRCFGQLKIISNNVWPTWNLFVRRLEDSLGPLLGSHPFPLPSQDSWA